MRKKKVEQQRGETLNQIRQDHLNRYLLARDLLQQLGLTDNILDAGCGVGYGSYMLSQVVGHVHAIDRELEIVDIFKHSYEQPNIKFESADLMTADLTAYDAVVCFELIEHVPDPETIIKRFSGVSDCLIISTPNETLYPHIRRNGNPHPFHCTHFTVEQFEQLLALGGFTVEKWFCQRDHIDCDIVDGTDGKYIIAVATK